ncbi:MAG: AAA family ATPase [Bdellovibrionales bacterium]|nr:AAA family ATPase [Bdellovibrionales bacterium]
MLFKRKPHQLHRPDPKLSKKAEAVIRYWEQSLLDGKRMELSAEQVSHASVAVERSDVARGSIGESVLGLLRERGTRERDSGRGGMTDVLLLPLQLERSGRTDRSRNAPRELYPFVLPAVLSSKGILSPATHLAPWIPRTLLEPQVSEQGITIGDTVSLESFVRQHPCPQRENWATYWRWSLTLFHKVTGKTLEAFKLDGYRPLANALLLADTTASGTGSLEKLYGRVLSGARPAGPLAALASIAPVERRAALQGTRKRAGAALLHSGQFEARFALAKSQRRALHECLLLRSGEILSVVGPPGTGKTTLIQSIVASLWVNAARTKQARPPVIAACAVTNQAVTNVLDSFAKATTQAGPLAGRWIPGLTSYGSFLPSKSKAQDFDADLPVELVDGTGASAERETWTFIAEAKRLYLARFAEFAFKTDSVESAVAHLQRCLRIEYAALYQQVCRNRDGTFGEWVKSLFEPKLRTTEAEFLLADAEIDTNARHRLFQLATHYWEGRWILEAPDAVERRPDSSSRRRPARSREDWERLAMLTPCFVATCFMLPRFFDDREHDAAPIDLLIADEAGQISPEIGAACFALADRGLVVGDDRQLQPVWNLPDYVDRGNAAQFRLYREGDDKSLRDLHRSGILAGSGNLMRVAVHSCPVVDGNTYGMFLSEHRRSVPEIVDFVNRLSYRGRLHSLRPPLQRRILPAFGYAQVRGVSQKSGQSRFNQLEADTIVDWLDRNQEMIEQYYGRPLAESVAILTPFAAQSARLKRLLSSRFRGMIIGSVNALQGAEAAIVLFSPVYDGSFRGTCFFDRSTHMLNVAVSRAKDSFLVFGDMDLFTPGTDRPSAVLARFLFATSENELLDIEPVSRPVSKDAIVSRLSGPDDHFGLLDSAFLQAQNRVIISSAGVSSGALERGGLLRSIELAIQRGVEVTAYVDDRFDYDPKTNEPRPNRALGRQLLARAGAKVFECSKIHNKGLVIDDDRVAEGSCNWLSAIRDKQHQDQKLEVSHYFEGPQAPPIIAKLLDELSKRVIRTIDYDPELYEQLRATLGSGRQERTSTGVKQ